MLADHLPRASALALLAALTACGTTEPDFDALSISTTTLPNAVPTLAYEQTLTATGGDGCYTWSVSSGTLPDGLALSASGVVTGTPTGPTSTFTLHVESGDGQTAMLELTLAVNEELAVTTASLPNGAPTVAYSVTLEAAGGDGGYAWSLESGSLPDGLSLGADGVITGTPTGSGSTFAVAVTSTDGQSGTRELTIDVDEVLEIVPTALPVAIQGIDYGPPALSATGGDGTYAWAVAAGSDPMPDGLSLRSDGGIEGNPEAEGSWDFTVEVESGGQTAQASVSITVEATVVRVCATPLGNLPTAATLADGILAVPEDGTLWMCDGAHVIGDVTIDKALTLEPEEGASATIEGTLLVSNPAGTVTVQGVTFQADGTILSADEYAEVVLQDLTFIDGAWASIGASAVTDATAVVSNSDFLGGERGLWVTGAPDVEVLDNYFEGQVTSAGNLQFQSDSNGTIARNEFDGCAFRGCIRVVLAGVVLIQDNVIRTTSRIEVFEGQFGSGIITALVADGVDVTAEGNLIEGVGAPTDPSDPNTYAIGSLGALAAWYGTGMTTLRDNVVRNAGRGISGAALELVATGNIVEDVHTAILLWSSLEVVDVHQNDMEGYVVSIDGTDDPVYTGSLTCNWWGDASGPANVVGITVTEVYAPFATEAIAGTGRSC